MKLTVPCCRRLCPEIKIVEHWVMEQSARWNGGSFRFCLVKSYFLQTGSSACFLITTSRKTELLLKIVKQTVNF